MVGAGVVLLAESSSAERLRAQGEPESDDAAARALAEKHSPILYIRDQTAPCDTRGSPYVPVPVEFVFGVEDIVLRRHADGRTTEEARAVDASRLYGLDDTYFLDFPGNPQRPGCRFEQDFLARSGDYEPTAYAHIVREDGRDGIALQYWLFYYFNHWNNTHEGDWEMIQLTFEGPTVEDALLQDPLGAGYSQHAGGERSDWDDDKLSKEGDHPVAFVAAGANANQFEPNMILGRGDNGTGFGCDDARRPSRRVAVEAVMVDEPDDASSGFAWLAFDGRWGERAPWEFNGPTGPNDKRAWTAPFSWQEDLRPSSIIVPTGATIGPNAVNVFCDFIWYMSTPFAWLIRLPGWVFAAGALASVGALAFVATRTSYRPIVVAPLRRHRRFGQIMSAAGRIYRQNLALFVAIGALFIPLGFLLAAVQWVVFQTPYEDTVSGFFSRNLAVEAVIALAIGNVASSLVVWLVGLATLTAVARIESREDNSVLEDYREMARKFPAVVVPRLKAVAIVVLLTVTVVGIPWAVRHVVRWAFIEEAILLDGVPSRDASAASARAVDGRWWHAAWALLVLGLLAYAAGPAVAFGLLLLSGAAVSTINIVSSLVFAAMTPFAAVARALLYFSLIAEDRPAID